MDKIYPLNEYDNNPSMHSAQRFYLFQNFHHDDKLCNVDLLLRILILLQYICWNLLQNCSYISCCFTSYYGWLIKNDQLSASSYGKNRNPDYRINNFVRNILNWDTDSMKYMKRSIIWHLTSFCNLCDILFQDKPNRKTNCGWNMIHYNPKFFGAFLLYICYSFVLWLVFVQNCV